MIAKLSTFTGSSTAHPCCGPSSTKHVTDCVTVAE